MHEYNKLCEALDREKALRHNYQCNFELSLRMLQEFEKIDPILYKKIADKLSPSYLHK